MIVFFAVALASAYYFFDPAEVRWMPRCIWKVATGTDCPGCGSQRMAHAIMHGDFLGAWHANAYALCMLPVVVFLIWIEFAKHIHPKLYAKVHHPVVITSLASSIFLWWLFRNLM
ncbi:MAG: DUF2752 domain-containing protein [Muribaculaceae bacterium]|nr:DUF2752 domain-containing protein [Muribaculaceae bacterium]